MEYDKMPQGFVMALTRNEEAVNAYSVMTKAQKHAVLEKARRVHSKQEMDGLMRELARTAAF